MGTFKEKRMNIFFKGYYGFNNIGDDVFVHTIDWFCKKNNFKYLIHGYNLPKGINGKNVKNKYSKLIFDLFYSIKGNQIIYWGGSTFEQISSKKDLKYFLNKVVFFNKKVLTMGVSIGPFATQESKDDVLGFIDKMKFVGVRDIASTAYSPNIEFTFDLAIITPLVFPEIQFKENVVNNQYTVSLNVSHANNFKEYTNIYKEFLIENKNFIEELNILVFNDDDDQCSRDIYNELCDEIKEVNFINYTSETDVIINKIANSDLLLGNRLHSAIIAYSYDVPFILNEYHAKCTDFLKTIEVQFTFENLAMNTNLNINDVIEMSKFRKKPLYFRNIALKKLEKIAKVIKNEDL